MITTKEVHYTIQQMNKGLLSDSDVIPMDTIADSLHVPAEELLIHIEMLAAMNYLKFADKKMEAVSLTFSGKNTLVPIFS